MPRGKGPKGICSFCRAEIAQSAVIEHLAACPKRVASVQRAESKALRSETLYHLQIRDAAQEEFWLDVEMRASSSLEDLDAYLRKIWLECCGHASRFSVGGWRGDEIPKHWRADETFARGFELTHIYDFKTISETRIKAIGARRGKPLTAHPMQLMARNLTPKARCTECKEPAEWHCPECLIDLGKRGTLCDEHMQAHLHDKYGGPVGLLNSPRVGMCKYRGPSKPPY